MDYIKNNKGFVAFIAIIIMSGLGFIIWNNNFSPASKVVDEVAEMGLNDSINKVTVDEARVSIDKGGLYAFILGDDTCPACIMFKGNLKHLVVDEDIKLDYIDLQVADQMEVSGLLEELEYDMTQGVSTPTTFIIEDGVVIATVVGAVEVDALMAEHGEVIRTAYGSDDSVDENTEVDSEETEDN